MNHSTVAKAIVSKVLAVKYDPAYWGTPTVRNVADTAAHGYIYGPAASIASEDYPSPSGAGWTVDMAHDINVYLTANYPDYWVGPYSGWLLAVNKHDTTPPAGGSGGPSFTVKTTGRDMVSDIVLAARDAGVTDAPTMLRAICTICNNPIATDSDGWAGGHNAEPITSGKCCEPCNRDMVTPARMQAMWGTYAVGPSLGKTCPDCSFDTNPGDNFCGKCGERL
jgi:hypothetical protein|tara:strand:+ start:1247 stop:1915 length:669 start_codon:yes stop_codon:yes gene_type:complete